MAGDMKQVGSLDLVLQALLILLRCFFVSNTYHKQYV